MDFTSLPCHFVCLAQLLPILTLMSSDFNTNLAYMAGLPNAAFSLHKHLTSYFFIMGLLTMFYKGVAFCFAVYTVCDNWVVQRTNKLIYSFSFLYLASPSLLYPLSGFSSLFVLFFHPSPGGLWENRTSVPPLRHVRPGHRSDSARRCSRATPTSQLLETPEPN